MNLGRLWHWAGGGVPAGLWPLLVLAAAWALLLLLVVRPVGVFRDRRPTPWLAGGWLVLLAAHAALRFRLTPPPPEALLLWPPERPAAGEAVFARAEQSLRALALEGGLIREGRPLPLRVAQHMLGPGRFQPATAAEADRLLAALGVRWLVQFREEELLLWQRAWSTCTLEDRAACGDPGRPDSLAAALHGLLARLVLDWRPPVPPATAWLPLYGPVTDSTAHRDRLPAGELPAFEDLRRSELQLALGASAEAEAGVRRALDLAERHPELGAEPWLLAGAWFARAGDWQQARQAMANSLSREGLHPQVYWQLGHVAPSRLADFGFPDRAAALRRCLELLPAHRLAVFDLADELARRGRLAEAVPAVEAALVAYPRDAELHLLRGNLAYQSLDHDQALRSYQESARLRPDDPRPWLNLGQVHVMHRDYRQAMLELTEAVSRGAPPAALDLLATAQWKAGRAAEAAATLRRRLELGGTPAELDAVRRLLRTVESGEPAR